MITKVIMIICGLVLLGVIIDSIRRAWKSDTYDVTGLLDDED